MYNVLVLNDDQLLGAAVASILHSHPHIHLYGLITDCVECILDALSQSSCDVLILDSQTALTEILTERLTQCDNNLRPRIITIDCNDNLIIIDGWEPCPITTAMDLIQIIQREKPKRAGENQHASDLTRINHETPACWQSHGMQQDINRIRHRGWRPIQPSSHH